ncbi:MAG: hypothetical protein ACREX3_13180 [Gammaproteobacteria bacterium]
MQASRRISKGDAFVCEADEVQRLAKLLESRVGDVSWEIGCADGIDRKGHNLEELLAFDNAPACRIEQLFLSARAKGGERTASIRLGGAYSTIEASTDGPAEFVEQLSTSLESHLSGLRTWYARVARLDFVNIGFLLLFSIFTVAILAVALGFSGTSDESTGSTARGQALVYTMIGGVIAVGWILNKLREELFPSVTFAVGQGKRRYETLQKTRWSVIVGFGISLLAGLTLLVIPIGR